MKKLTLFTENALGQLNSYDFNTMAEAKSKLQALELLGGPEINEAKVVEFRENASGRQIGKRQVAILRSLLLQKA